ncbi:MAG: helix-turn-helix transcriptional regulator [Eubacterium sp.]|jgi:transcriptional regulator with XRE-family HTH domain|nr:helix-turn-helix transcriptional regulator [Eubacterium sp.]
MSMAERIRYLVKRHPKSRQEIAGDLYISTDSLGNYITGRRCPDAAMVRKMAIYFQVSADYILCVTPTLEDTFTLPTIEQEQSLLSLFRTMTPIQRELFLHSGYGITSYATIQQVLPVMEIPGERET